MARDFGPFPSKPMYEVVNRRMQRALAEAAANTGFAKTGQGAVTAGTGAQLVIAAYPDGALVDGLYVENPASETVTLTTNTGSTNPRIDRLVMRLDMAAETIEPFQIVGTPAASPQAPPLVQTAAVYDLPLCRYTFPGSASAQNPGSIVDERMWLTLPSCSLRQTTTQGVNANAWTPITFGSADIDTDGMFDPGSATRVTIKQKGIYRVGGLVAFFGASSAYRLGAQLTKNGTALPSSVNTSTVSGQPGGAYTSVTVQLAAGDYVGLNGVHSFGPSLGTAVAADTASSLSVECLRLLP